MRIFVAGAGAWGTALAMLLDENGHAVTLWTRNAEKAREIDVTRQNPALAGVTLPAGIRVTAELAEAEDAELVLYAVPSFALRETAQAIAPYLPSEAVLVSATKGIERSTNARMTEIIAEYAGMGGRSLRSLARRMQKKSHAEWQRGVCCRAAIWRRPSASAPRS